ncbi:cation-translocating P-type ATPase [Nocardioides sp.]|uniref:cation-translocating P-type ATPase n=1 Tax=Nocardioides sp. TaxID=35761 RepID=UPI003D127F6E
MTRSGLSNVEVARLLRENGPNEIHQRGRVSVWSRVGLQLRDPLIMVLLAACALTTATGDLTDAAVIALVVLVNTTVGVAQELKADRAITALTQLTTPAVRVLREGVDCSIPASQLVPGDIVLLGEGDVVPADCDLLEASSLLIDESALTGESVAVGKTAARGEQAGDTVSSGTVVVKGRAVARVTRTGGASSLGRIAELMDSDVQATPLQRRLAGLGRTLALVAIALSALVLALGLARGQPLELMVITAISLAVAAVPESLPAVVTFSLALGARRMAARHAVVRHLAAVETLGSVTVLATDKTGTLTQARMVVEELWTPARQAVTPHPESGVFSWHGEVMGLCDAPDVVELLSAGVLCNDASLAPPGGSDGSAAGMGDPTEVAMLGAAEWAGLSRGQLAVEYPRIGEVPFDSVAQMMTTAHRSKDPDTKGLLVVTKGSIEALRGRHDPRSKSKDWHEALVWADSMAAEGYRVLAVASGRAASSADWEGTEQRLLGLFAMNDPAKPAAKATIAACRSAGIIPVLITGDHPATARAIALRVGVLDVVEGAGDGAVVTGPQISAGEPQDLTQARVFARTSPEQKLDIVRAWQDAGAVVAMTGDGVNDGPALHRSDIGVAMGGRGTEVARQAAQLVLADDDLGTLVAAVEEGRRVYANIRMFLVFGLAGGAAEILVMLLGPFTGLVVPLLAAQILWINLLTHGLTGVAMGAEPAAPDLMSQSPRPPEQSVLGAGLWQRVLALGVVLAGFALGLGLWAEATDRAWQTMIFLALTSLQLGVALGLRPRQFGLGNPLLPAAVLGSFLLAVAGVYLPVLQELLGTVALPWGDLVIAGGTGIVGWCAAQVSRRAVGPSAPIGATTTPAG